MPNRTACYNQAAKRGTTGTEVSTPDLALIRRAGRLTARRPADRGHRIDVGWRRELTGAGAVTGQGDGFYAVKWAYLKIA